MIDALPYTPPLCNDLRLRCCITSSFVSPMRKVFNRARIQIFGWSEKGYTKRRVIRMTDQQLLWRPFRR